MQLRPLTDLSCKPRIVVWKRVVTNILLLTIGSIIFAAGVNAFLVPHRFLSGGVIGVALIAHYLSPTINIGLAYFVMNIPLILMGWFSLSRTFVFYTAYGMATVSLASGIIHPPIPVIDNLILAAISSGVVCGAGVGLSLRSEGSGGGFDILAIYLSRKIGISLGTSTFAANALVLAIGGWVFNVELALYSLIYIYTAGKVIDAVVSGFNQRKSIFIISDCAVAISNEILGTLNRGVTFMDGCGAYSGEPKKVIFSIISLTELSRLKQIVFDLDPGAFLVVNDTLEVIGKRHGSMRLY